MKPARNLFPRIVDRDNLRLAFYRAQRGKRDRIDVRTFAANLEDNLQLLSLLFLTTFWSFPREFSRNGP